MAAGGADQAAGAPKTAIIIIERRFKFIIEVIGMFGPIRNTSQVGLKKGTTAEMIRFRIACVLGSDWYQTSYFGAGRQLTTANIDGEASPCGRIAARFCTRCDYCRRNGDYRNA